MDIYISFIDILLDPSTCHEIKKTPWGSFSWDLRLQSHTPGSWDESLERQKPLGLNFFEAKERERERYISGQIMIIH